MSSPTYTKQEQEPASEEVTEVADGVLRMQLPISLPGLGHVNCYALVDGDEFVVAEIELFEAGQLAHRRRHRRELVAAEAQLLQRRERPHFCWHRSELAYQI